MSATTMDRAATSGQRPGPADLFRTLGTGEAYKRAEREGMTLSALLEREDPSDRYQGAEREMDAFERLLAVANIRTTSDPQGNWYASPVEAFDEDDNTRALFPEFCARTYRRITHAGRRTTGQRTLMTSDKYGVGTSMRPYVDEAMMEYQRIEVVLPLSEMLAASRAVRGNRVRAFRITDTAAQRKMVRVAEGTEIPRTTIVGAERDIPLVKRGRAIEVTYETLRNAPIDEVAWFLMRVAIQSETDKVARALDIAVNGDGNANTGGTVHNLSTLDASAGGVLTLQAWLKFKFKFRNPYTLTHILGREDALMHAFLLDTGTANVPLIDLGPRLGFGGFTTINPQLADNVRVGLSDDAPANQLIGFDRRFALTEYTEIGSDISESMRWILNQTEVLTMTENWGMKVSEPAAVHILALNL